MKRKALGWSQQDLADQAGVARNTIAKAERKTNCNQATLTKITDILYQSSPPQAGWTMPAELLTASLEENLSVKAAYMADLAQLKPREMRSKKDWVDLIHALAVFGDIFVTGLGESTQAS